MQCFELVLVLALALAVQILYPGFERSNQTRCHANKIQRTATTLDSTAKFSVKWSFRYTHSLHIHTFEMEKKDRDRMNHIPILFVSS